MPNPIPEAPSGDGRLRIAVLGPGGVGGLLAALLAQHGCDVTCLAGASTVAVLREQGVRLTSNRFGPVSADVRATEHLDHPVDVCFVTVKATSLDAALERLPAELLGDALVVPLLNGVEHVAELRRRYPRATVVAATIRVESTRTAPATVRHDSPFAAIELAAPAGAPVRRLTEQLRLAGLDVEVRDDETAVLWDKLSFLAPMALLTTYTGASAGTVRGQHRATLQAVVQEVAAVATAEGRPRDPAAVLAMVDSLPAGMQSSMQRDAAAGREIEVEAIGGAVLRAAARHGVPVPETTRLIEELRERQATR